MEYYHLHTKGIKDNFWKEKREFIIDEKFRNRLCERYNNFSLETPENDVRQIYSMIDPELANAIFGMFGFDIDLDYLIHYCLENGINNRSMKMLLEISKKRLYDARIFKREMALENYRKDNYPNLPSRLHSLFVTTEQGISYWKDRLIDNDLEIFKLDVVDTPFITNEQYLPYENLNYGDSYQAASGYWHPSLKDDYEFTREYLVQGKVKILEKVDEISKKYK